MSSILETAFDAFISIDAAGNVTVWNRRAEILFGWDRDEAIGRSVADLIIPQQHRQAHQLGLAHYLETGEGPVLEQRLELTAINRAEVEFPVELTIWPLDTESGISFNAFVHDISRRKQDEEELCRFAEQLQQSNRDLEQYAYVASHDLQEPLRSVISFLQLLERKYRANLPQQAKEYIDFAVTGGRQMKTLITALLAYSRIGSRTLPFSRVDLNEVLGEVRELFREKPTREAQIEWTELPKVWGDRSQLVQLFQNLVGNALKFRKPECEPRVRVEAERQQEHWQLSVSDNGIGIEPEYLEKIFVIFQRLHTREVYPGAGIGLSLSKRIVERHNGVIWVESQKDEGSTFRFTLAEPSVELEDDKSLTEFLP